MNKLAQIGLISFGLLTLPKAFKLASNYLLEQGMELKLSPEIHTQKDGILIILGLDVANPTDKSLSIASPLIELLHRGKILTQTHNPNNRIEINAQSEVRIPVRLFLKWEQIQDLFSEIQSSKSNHQALDLAINITHKEPLNQIL